MVGTLPVACSQSHPKNTINDFLKRGNTGPLELKIEQSAMSIS